MAIIFVRPREGGRVRMPERNFIPMPATGAWISRVDYYERLLIGGDIVIADAPAAPAEPIPEPGRSLVASGDPSPDPFLAAVPESDAAGSASSKEK